MKIINFIAVDILPSLLDKTKTSTIRPAWENSNAMCRVHFEDGYDEGDMCTECSEYIGFCDNCNGFLDESNDIYCKDGNDHYCKNCLPEKPPRFKVKDKIQLMWDRNSKNQFYCRKHTNPIIIKYSNLRPKFCVDNMTDKVKNFAFGNKCNCTPQVIYKEMDRELFDSIFFNKLLGTGIITEVFKIEMMCYKSKNKYMIVRVPRKKRSFVCIYPEGINLHYHIESNLLNNKEIEDLAKRDGFKDAKSLFSYFDKTYDLSSAKTFYTTRWRWD